MKKLLGLFVCVLVMLTLSSCNIFDLLHTHSYTEKNTDEKYLAAKAECESAAKYYYSCECGEQGSEIFTHGKATGHTEVIDAAKAPTCDKEGLTEGAHCSNCSKVFTAQKTVAALGHTEVIDEAEAPTCDQDGLTEGAHCSVCSKVLAKQETVAALGHAFTVEDTDEKYLASPANCTNGTKYYYSCASCGAQGEETFIAGAPNGDHDIDESGYCIICKQSLGTRNGVLYEISSDGTYAEAVGYNGADTRIIIEDTYKGVPVTKIYKDAFKNSNITSVIIPRGITAIGSSAFEGCKGLTSVVIPDGVTTLGSYMFYGCTALTSVVIPESVTSLGAYMFYGCKGLIDVKIPNSVPSLGSYAFYGCTGLTSIVIPDSVTSIGSSAFSTCTALASVTFGNGITSIGASAFYDCHTLTSIEIPDNVISIGASAFAHCYSIKSVTIGNGVERIGNMAFYNCTSLTSIVFADTSAWYITKSSTDWQNKTGGTFTDVTNHEKSAKYFTNTSYYYDYYWYKV